MSKYVVESCQKLEISWLRKQGYLAPGDRAIKLSWKRQDGGKNSISVYIHLLAGEKPYIRFQYSGKIGDQKKQKLDYNIPLAATPCNYGGKRYWFSCQLGNNGSCVCTRRVGVLYLVPYNNFFGCRHCFRLSYYRRNRSHKRREYFLNRLMDIDERLEKMQESCKRDYYANRPTRKYRQMLKLEAQINPYARQLYEEEGR